MALIFLQPVFFFPPQAFVHTSRPARRWHATRHSPAGTPLTNTRRRGQMFTRTLEKLYIQMLADSKKKSPLRQKRFMCFAPVSFHFFFLFKSSIHPVLFTFGTAVVISLFRARFRLFGRDSLSWYQIGVVTFCYLAAVGGGVFTTLM